MTDAKCAREEISHGQEKRSALNDDTVPRKKDTVPGDDFEQLVQELEFVERETGLHDALLFLEFDKYYNSWNKPLNCETMESLALENKTIPPHSSLFH